MPTTPVHALPKPVRKQILLDCYNALCKSGKTHEQAKHEISHYIVCSRLVDLECLIDIRRYHL